MQIRLPFGDYHDEKGRDEEGKNPEIKVSSFLFFHPINETSAIFFLKKHCMNKQKLWKNRKKLKKSISRVSSI